MESLLNSTTFWVGVAVFTFIALVWKPLGRVIGGFLDNHAAEIEKEISEATRLREEAQETLLAYQQKQKEIESEAKAILEKAKSDVKLMKAEAKKQLKKDIEKRTLMAENRIAEEERRAIQKVQRDVVSVAVDLSKEIIAKDAKQATEDNLVAIATDSVNNLVH